MTTLTINIDNEKDLPILKEILNCFGLDYKIDEHNDNLSKEGEVLYKELKTSMNEIKNWEQGKVKLQNAKDAIAEIETELDQEEKVLLSILDSLNYDYELQTHVPPP